MVEIGADIGDYLGDAVLIDEVAEIEAAVVDQGLGEFLRRCRFGVEGIYFWRSVVLGLLVGELGRGSGNVNCRWSHNCGAFT